MGRALLLIFWLGIASWFFISQIHHLVSLETDRGVSFAASFPIWTAIYWPAVIRLRWDALRKRPKKSRKARRKKSHQLAETKS